MPWPGSASAFPTAIPTSHKSGGWLDEQWGLDTANGYYLMYLAVPLGLGLLALCVALLAAALGSGLGTGRWLWRRLSRLLPLA